METEDIKMEDENSDLKTLQAENVALVKERDKWQAAYNELKNSAKAKKSEAYQ